MNDTTLRYLTKSRFNLALECPTKLYYTGKREYLDTSLEDSFLLSLTEGGYQVGELARWMYPGGELVRAQPHAEAVRRTLELLARDTVTIYEAALRAGSLFVRVDVLRKQGKLVELIEVKAKSWDPVDDAHFRGAKRQIDRRFLPYLQDIAFQRHVAGLALPGCTFRSFLMLADKSRRATVDGLNQRFKVRREGTHIEATTAPGTDAVALGEPILTAVPVDDLVEEILAGVVNSGGVDLPFAQGVHALAEAYAADRRIAPQPGAHCANCHFQADAPPVKGEPKSGFHECWREAFGFDDADFAGGTVLDLWNYGRKQDLMDRGVRHLSQVNPADLGLASGATQPASGEPLKRAHRQWYQCRPGQAGWPGGGAFYLGAQGLAKAMESWRYPLNFIDFETCAVAIPFRRGHRPYETVAFQFSHHVMDEVGRIAHRTQFLCAKPGEDPTVPFVEALKDALLRNGGSVLRWATHENTVLNHLRQRLRADESLCSVQRTTLVAFIESITQRDEGKTRVAGPRNMVDLCKLAEQHFFHPETVGSSSLKKVLPAVMRSSTVLRELYSAPRYGTDEMPSLNPGAPTAWWVQRDGHVCDPYELLPPVFADLTPAEQAALEAGVAPELAEGGAAMAAYARLQFEHLGMAEREAIELALKRYCELDTLAMVMVVQAWIGWMGRMQRTPDTKAGDQHP